MPCSHWDTSFNGGRQTFWMRFRQQDNAPRQPWFGAQGPCWKTTSLRERGLWHQAVFGGLVGLLPFLVGAQFLLRESSTTGSVYVLSNFSKWTAVLQWREQRALLFCTLVVFCGLLTQIGKCERSQGRQNSLVWIWLTALVGFQYGCLATELLFKPSNSFLLKGRTKQWERCDSDNQNCSSVSQTMIKAVPELFWSYGAHTPLVYTVYRLSLATHSLVNMSPHAFETNIS